MITYAQLMPDSPRRETWLAIIGEDRIPLRSSDARMAKIPGMDGPRRCYIADAETLTRNLTISVRRRLFAYLAERFELVDWLAALSLVEGPHGLPILDGPDLIVTTEARAYL